MTGRGVADTEEHGDFLALETFDVVEHEEFSLIERQQAEGIGDCGRVVTARVDNVDGIIGNRRPVGPADPLPMEVPGDPQEPGSVGRVASESVDADQCPDERVLREVGGVCRLATHAAEVRVDRVFVALEFCCELVLFHIPHLVAPNVVGVTRFLPKRGV